MNPNTFISSYIYYYASSLSKLTGEKVSVSSVVYGRCVAEQLRKFSMKGPNRGGRILKDPRNGLGVAPLTSAEIGSGVGKGIHSRADNQLPQLVPHAPLITRRRSSIDPLSSDSLQKHIHELEIENLQLKSRLQETELSLKNYKDFLTTKSSLNNQNISTQTDNYDNDEDDNINHEKSILNNEIKLLQNENVTLKNQINSLMINQTTSNNISQEYNQKIQELEQSLLMMKRKKSKVKKMSTPPPREDMKVNYKELIATELNDFNKLLCCNLELIRHRISSFNQHSPKGKISIPLKIPPVDQACGPMTPTVVDRSHDPPTPSLKFNGWSVSPIPPRQKIESVTVATNTDPLDEKQDDELANQLQLQTLLAQSLSERLLSASKSVHGVVTKFGNEINAIKHWAHCKELVRVATLRELGLEKDRLLNELKYSKYVLIMLNDSFLTLF